MDAPKPLAPSLLAAIVAMAALVIAQRTSATRNGIASRLPPQRHGFVTPVETQHAVAEPPPMRVAVNEEVTPLANPDLEDAGAVSAIDSELVRARQVALCVTYDHSLAEVLEIRIERADGTIHDSPTYGSTSGRREMALRIPRREIGVVETIHSRLEPGRYELSCHVGAGAEYSIVGDGTLHVDEDGLEELVIPLRVIRGIETLRGRIVEPSGAGVRGAQIRVEAVRNEGDRSLRVVRDVASTRDGSFEMKGLSDVPYRVDVIWIEGCMNPCRFGFTSKAVIAPSPREALEIVVGDSFDVDVFVQHPSAEGHAATGGEFDVLLEPLTFGDTKRATAMRSPESRTTIVSFQRVPPGPHRVRVIERGTVETQRERTFEVESAAVGGGRGAIQVLVPVDP